MRKLVELGIAVLLSVPAPASAQELCASLERIVRSAGEPTPFASLVASWLRFETSTNCSHMCAAGMMASFHVAPVGRR